MAKQLIAQIYFVVAIFFINEFERKWRDLESLKRQRK
jgi:hypothetical protein